MTERSAAAGQTQGAISVQVTFDARDPWRLAEFWATTLGYVLEPPPPGYESWYSFAQQMDIPREQWNDVAAVVDPGSDGPRLLFKKVPERKIAKNRIHLDVNVSLKDNSADPTDRARIITAHVDRLIQAGASVVEEREEMGHAFVVMQDPEGNKFCVQ